MTDTVTLYRPVGQRELELIAESGYRAFPPRLGHQPIFYPVTNEAYATQIARDWNTRDEASGFVGYVTRFAVDAAFLARYPVRRVGGATHEEYWVPAAELAEFNRHLVGPIEVIAEFRSGAEAPLGLARGVVRVVAADERWPALFRDEAGRLAAAVARAGLPPLAFEHIGSTSVPGLAAKPILDLMAGHPPGADGRPYLELFVACGYEARGPQGVAGREFFALGPHAARTHHLNLTEAGGEFWRTHLAFRDRLRGDPALAAAYADLKHELARRHVGDRAAYTEGKAAFVAGVVGTKPSRTEENMAPQVGQKARRALALTAEHVATFAALTGDYNPLHFDADFAARTRFGALVVQGGLTTGLLHALVAMDLPGPGSVFLSQQWRFTAPVYIGDTITAEAEVLSVHATKPVTQLRVQVTRQTGETVLEGEAWCYTMRPDAGA